MNDLLYWIGLNSIRGIGPRRIHLLLKTFDTPRNVLEAPLSALASVDGVDRRSAQAVASGFDREFAESQIRQAKEQQVAILTLGDDSYPAVLRELYSPPPVLYVRGHILDTDQDALGIVGSRQVSVFGRAATQTIAKDLARAGICIVSGMARGIDAIAHRTAIENGGRTLAVLGCGVDICYPRMNGELMQAIHHNGAVVSEFPLGTEPDTFHFPRRNRIISGLSRGVLVTEAGRKSGALITAEFAMEQGREVFAIPGPITMPSFEGCNRLIQNGAGLVRCAEDVLEPLQRFFGRRGKERRIAPPVSLSEDENSVFLQLSYEPIHVDALAQKCEAPPSKVLGVLLGLELRGVIQQLAGKNFVKA